VSGESRRVAGTALSGAGARGSLRTRRSRRNNLIDCFQLDLAVWLMKPLTLCHCQTSVSLAVCRSSRITAVLGCRGIPTKHHRSMMMLGSGVPATYRAVAHTQPNCLGRCRPRRASVSMRRVTVCSASSAAVLVNERLPPLLEVNGEMLARPVPMDAVVVTLSHRHVFDAVRLRR